eukprot:2853133-Rhodomonas_salina.2
MPLSLWDRRQAHACSQASHAEEQSRAEQRREQKRREEKRRQDKTEQDETLNPQPSTLNRNP